MALVDIEVALLHAPHFHVTANYSAQGINMSDKLDTRDPKRRDMKLKWDEVKQELLVDYMGRVGEIPAANVKAKFRFLDKVIPLPKNESPMPRPKVSAQVDTPQSHVHAGLGHGKTGQTHK